MKEKDIIYPKKDFKREYTVCGIVATALVAASGLWALFGYKLVALGFGACGIICYCLSGYFYVAKPKPLFPKISSTSEANF